MSKVKASKKPAKPQKKKVKCEDCGQEYTVGAPHHMFCAARTCDECGTTFRQVLERDLEGLRLCDECGNNQVDDDYEEDEDYGEDEE